MASQDQLAVDDYSSKKELHTTECEDIDVLDKAPWLCSCRLTLGLVGFLGFLNLYALRINMSVAMVCMVNQTAVRDMTPGYQDLMLEHNDSICPAVVAENTAVNDGEFVWSKELQGIILGSFFWGYIVTQIPGGWMAGRYGGKRVFGYCMLVTAVATLLAPVGARTSPYMLMTLRLLAGVGEGVAFPAMSAMWAKWAPKGERAILISLTYAGCQFGNVVTLPTSGLLCERGFAGGWPSIFYVFGTFGVVWFILWMVLAYDSPAQHPRITERERRYIEHSIGATKKLPSNTIPWRHIFSSIPVWNLIVCHTCVTWGIYTLLTNIPTFMREVLKFDIKSNGLFSAIPYLAFGVVTMSGGIISDKLLEKGLSVVRARKLFYSLGTIVPGLFLVGTGYVTCDNQYQGVLLLTIAMGFSGFQFTGFTVNCVDIAPPFAGIIFGIENTAATVSGILAPYVIGIMTVDQTQVQWQRVFYLAAGVYIFGAVFFCIFARGEVQSWARPYMYEEGDDRLEMDITDGDKKTGEVRSATTRGEVNLAIEPDNSIDVRHLSGAIDHTEHL